MRATPLAVPAGHATSVACGKPMAEAMPNPVACGKPMAEAMPKPVACGKPMAEAMPKPVTEAVREAMVEMVEALHDDDRRCEAEKPGSSPPTPIGSLCPIPRRREVGVGIGRGVRGIRRRRNLVDLRRQAWRGLGDPPAPVGLLAGFDDRLLRLPPDRDRRGVAGAGRLRRGRLSTRGRH